MKSAPLNISDGRTLQQLRGKWILQPDGITVDVEREGDEVRVIDPDTGKPVYKGPLEVINAGSGQPAGKAAATPGRPAAGAGRWQTFNEFIDNIGPELTLAEREVWHVMFRHARGGVVETTARRLATACRIDKATVVRAHARLEAIGLIRTIWRSTDRSKASKYGLHPSPAACLPKLLASRSPK